MYSGKRGRAWPGSWSQDPPPPQESRLKILQSQVVNLREMRGGVLRSALTKAKFTNQGREKRITLRDGTVSFEIFGSGAFRLVC